MKKRVFWKTRMAFYLAAIGSACGLGNLWRFPYVVGENGGGAFVLLYVLLAFTVGLALLVGELILGRASRAGVLESLGKVEVPGLGIKPGGLRWLGWLSLAVTLIVLSYYAVISGWVLHYATQFLIFSFKTDGTVDSLNLANLASRGLLQIGLASVHVMICSVVVVRGFQEGLEKWIGYMMPVFIFLLVLLVIRSLSLTDSSEAMRFLFYPDFSRLTWSSLSHALGHVLFTLSLGLGTMVTFGSYLRENDHAPSAGFRVTSVDTFLSLLGGVLVFPIVIKASNVPLTDPGLLFEALPKLFAVGQSGIYFGFVFFVCLYLSALGASIGLMEGIISNLMPTFKITRTRATQVVALSALAFSIFPALSYSQFSLSQTQGKGYLQVIDGILINWFLPIIVLGISLVLGFGFDQKKKKELFIDVNKIESVALFSYWDFILKYVTPVIIVLALALNTIGLFRN